MEISEILLQTVKFFIPSFFSLLFRVRGLGANKKSNVIIGFIIFTLYSLTVPSLLIWLIGYGEYTHIASIVMIIGGLSILLFSSDRPGKTVFLHFIQANVIASMSTILNMFRHLFQFSYFTLLIAIFVCSSILFFIAMKYWVKPMRFIADNLHSSTVPLIAIPIITLIIIMIIPTYPKQNFQFHPVYCTLMMLLVETGFFLYIYNLYKNLMQISIYSKQESKFELLQTELSTYDEYLVTARQNRHDLRHHNILLLEYLNNSEIDNAKKYLQHMNDDLMNNALLNYCDNSIANTILRFYEKKTTALDIAYSVLADFPPSICLSTTEICVVLSNILENAILACTEAKPNNSYIAIAIKKDNHHLKINITNTAIRTVLFDKDDLPISNKIIGGIGTQSIVSIVKKYNGLCNFSQENEVFSSQILIPLK